MAKSIFRFVIHANPVDINNVIQRYLHASGFIPVPKPNANYYFFNDPMLKGKRSFEYYINGQEVTIYAYLGKFEKPKELEGFVGAVPKQSYKNELQVLIDELKRMDMSGINAMAAQANQGQYCYAPGQNAPVPPQGQYGYPPVQDPGMDRFSEMSNKGKDTLVITGFVMSIIGVFLSIFGVLYGAILLFFEMYCGIQGVHSRKKGLAITTIVLASLSIVIIVIEIVYWTYNYGYPFY